MAILDEKLLASDFTFGFELEAYLDDTDSLVIDKSSDNFNSFCDMLVYEGYFDNKESAANAFDTMSDFYEFDSNASIEPSWEQDLITEEQLFGIAEQRLKINKYFPEGASWIKKESSGFTYDGSLGAGGFEWRSPVMLFTPESIAHCIAFLNNFSDGCHVDDSCGFHTHISFNGITEDDARWLTIRLSQDPEIIKKIQNLNHMEDRNKDEKEWKHQQLSFYSKWSSIEYLHKISLSLHTNDIQGLANLLNNEKYRALRIHPQGTLEWRSPRNFLEMGSGYIKSYFLSLYEFINWMRDNIDAGQVGIYDKYNLLEMIKSFSKGKELFNISSKTLFKKIEKMYDSIIKNPLSIQKYNQVPLKHCVSFVEYCLKGDKIHHNDMTNALLDVCRKDREIPNNLLSAFISVYSNYKTPEIGNVVENIHQQLPINEIEKTEGIRGTHKGASLFRLFEYLSKDDIINFIKNTSLDYSDFCWFMGSFSHQLKMTLGNTYPAWFYNAIFEKYGKKPEK